MYSITSKQLLEIINKYDALSLEELAYNLRKAMGTVKETSRQQDYWLADLYGTTRNTTYSWFAPHRNEKAPLKAVAKISDALNIPLMNLLEAPKKTVSIHLRQYKKRQNSFEIIVISHYKEHPECSVDEIADALGITSETVRRHLKNQRKVEN